jgi:hypothetical protein
MGLFRMDSVGNEEIREKLATESRVKKNGRRVPGLLEDACGPIRRLRVAGENVWLLTF